MSEKQLTVSDIAIARIEELATDDRLREIILAVDSDKEDPA